MNRNCSTKKRLLKISQYSQENTSVRIFFFNKNAGLQACSFIKTRLQHSCFLVSIEKYLTTPILKNICERLLLRVFLERFPTWTNNIGSEEDVFSKAKQKQKKETVLKLRYMKKNLPFHDVLYHFLLLYFSTARQAGFALHNKIW